mmetsp:Transcript_122364/g.261102  ORF Transcript_122364/g.261102 Transcript_122364/m.261102 type:complete len:224 (-) Transcript_122364:183-854(-)
MLRLRILQLRSELFVVFRRRDAHALNDLADDQRSGLLLAPSLLLLSLLLQLSLPLLHLFLLLRLALPRLLIAFFLLLKLLLLQLRLPLLHRLLLRLLRLLPLGNLCGRGCVLHRGRDHGRTSASHGGRGSRGSRGHEPQSLIDGSIPRHLPTKIGRGRSRVRVQRPDLIATHLWPEPPAAKGRSVALVPEVDQDTDARHSRILLEHWLAVIRPLLPVGALDDT